MSMCISQLRRLAQKAVVAGLGRGIFLEHFPIKRLFWDVLVHFDCERSHERSSLWEDLVEILVTSSVRGPCMILYRSLWEDHAKAKVMWRSGWNPLFYRSFWEDLVEILLKSSQRSLHDLVQVPPHAKIMWRSGWSPLFYCTGPSEILWRSCWNWPKRSLHDVVQALVRRSWSKILWVSLHDFYRSFWEDLVEILFGSSLRGLASRSSLKMLCMILCRFLTEDLVEIRVRSSGRDPCTKILQMPCLPGACMKVLVGGSWEVLVPRSCKLRSSSKSFYDDFVSLVLLGCW